MVFMDHKIAIVPLKIVGEDIDLTRVMHGQRIPHALFSFDTKGSGVIGFGHYQIGNVLLLGLHWPGHRKTHKVEAMVVGLHRLDLLRTLLHWSVRFLVLQWLPVWREDPVDVYVFFPFLFLDFFGGEGSLYVTAMGLGVDVL